MNVTGLYNGTRGRTRTGTLLRAGDFESPVSTNFTTLALLCDAVSLGGEYINASALFKALYLAKRVTKLTPPPLVDFGSARVDRKAVAGQWQSSSASY